MGINRGWLWTQINSDYWSEPSEEIYYLGSRWKSMDFKAIDSNTRMKPEEDGSIIPHYFIQFDEIEKLLYPFQVIKIKHVEDFFHGKSSWHYFVHCRKL